MSFNYKNPISPLSVLGNTSVSRKEVFGTNFSVLSTGGYMEVFSLSDLLFTVPVGTKGLVEYSGNTIPIQLNIGTGSAFSPDVLTLNSDNISSGRRRIGMLVYVIDEEQIYQYQIPNFDTLWNAAIAASGVGGPTVVFSDYGTTVKGNSPQGLAFINAWRSNTIEGVGSGNSLNSVWKKFVTGSDFTGGTVTGATYFSNGLSANTFSATTYLGLPADFNTFVTGYTYGNNKFTIFDNSGNTFSATINNVTGLTINGNLNVTGNSTFNSLSANSISATTYLNLPTDFNTFVTGFSYNNNTFTISDNSGSTFNATINSVTGLTVNGGLSATTISATTYQNLPKDIFVTGGTFSGGSIIFTNNSGGTFNVSGISSFDTFVTGFTYNNNTLTILQNSGSPLSVTINTFTGLTINGGLVVTGNSQLNGGISSTSFTGTTDRIVQVNSGGTFTAVTDIISAYISSASTAATLLSNVANWDINGNYIGLPISGTFQGQKWYDGNYFYEAIQDNVFIRLIRG